MKLFLFGKTRTVTRLTEEAAAAWRACGVEVRLFAYRDTAVKKRLEPLLMAPWLGEPYAALAASRVRRDRPDLILGIGPFHWLPLAVFSRLRQLADRPPMVAWIGDRFGPDAAPHANLFDLIAYTDSGLVDLHKQFRFRAEALYLPLAADPAGGLQNQPEIATARDPRLLFVASRTDHRLDLLRSLSRPVSLYGRDWSQVSALAAHDVHAERVGPDQLAALYRRHLAVLNIRHELNVINGLNQRHFAPPLAGAAVVSDLQSDLPLCFEPGTEVVTYSGAEDLADVQQKLIREPQWGARVAERAQARVLASHTYAHRLARLAAALNLKA